MTRDRLSIHPQQVPLYAQATFMPVCMPMANRMKQWWLHTQIHTFQLESCKTHQDESDPCADRGVKRQHANQEELEALAALRGPETCTGPAMKRYRGSMPPAARKVAGPAIDPAIESRRTLGLAALMHGVQAVGSKIMDTEAHGAVHHGAVHEHACIGPPPVHASVAQQAAMAGSAAATQVHGSHARNLHGSSGASAPTLRSLAGEHVCQHARSFQCAPSAWPFVSEV